MKWIALLLSIVALYTTPHSAWADDRPGGGGSPPPPVPTVTVPSCSLSASPSTIQSGQVSTLSLAVTNVRGDVSIDQGVGTVTPPWSGPVTPSVTTTYTATAPTASVTCSVTVTIVVPPPPPSPPSAFRWKQLVGKLNVRTYELRSINKNGDRQYLQDSNLVFNIPKDGVSIYDWGVVLYGGTINGINGSSITVVVNNSVPNQFEVYTFVPEPMDSWNPPYYFQTSYNMFVTNGGYEGVASSVFVDRISVPNADLPEVRYQGFAEMSRVK